MPALYTLESGVELQREAPETFWLPPAEQREHLPPGSLVKLVFRIRPGNETHVERMWVRVIEVRPETYVGILDNDAYCTNELRCGLRVEFNADHVIQIWQEAK